MKHQFISIVSGALLALAVNSASAAVITFSGGTATKLDGTTFVPADGVGTQNAKSYVENGMYMVIENGTRSIALGNYYGGVGDGVSGNSVIHGHWTNMERVYFAAQNGAAFNLTYLRITSNSTTANGPVYIVASQDGLTASYSQKLEPSTWGYTDFNEIYFGAEFRGIKAFWFEARGTGAFCFGMDNFHVDIDPPAPSGTSGTTPLIVGTGSVPQCPSCTTLAASPLPTPSVYSGVAPPSNPAPTTTPNTPQTTESIPTLGEWALIFLASILGFVGYRKIRGSAAR